MPFMIGIGGPSGSGKTTLAGELEKHYGSDSIVVISIDNYYKNSNTFPADHPVNYDHPESLDFVLLAEHIQKLRNNEPVEIPIYDFKTSSRTNQTETIPPKRYIVVEGILALHDPNIRALFDYKIYVETPLEVCLTRRIERDMKERGRHINNILDQYKNQVHPMTLEFVLPSKSYADCVFGEGKNAFFSRHVTLNIAFLLSALSKQDPAKEKNTGTSRLFSSPSTANNNNTATTNGIGNHR